jgi:hypothetical protein
METRWYLPKRKLLIQVIIGDERWKFLQAEIMT